MTSPMIQLLLMLSLLSPSVLNLPLLLLVLMQLQPLLLPHPLPLVLEHLHISGNLARMLVLTSLTSLVQTLLPSPLLQLLLVTMVISTESKLPPTLVLLK